MTQIIDKIKSIENGVPLDQKKVNKLNKIHHTAATSLIEWKETPPGFFGGIQKLLAKVNIGKAEAKKTALTPHLFHPIDSAKKEALEKKVKLFKIITIVSVVASILFIAIGLLGPLAAVPFLIALPLNAALGVIIGTTVVGIVGVALGVWAAFLSNTKAVRRLRVDADPDFQYFIDRFIQQVNPKESLAFNLSKGQIMDKKIHQIYSDWKSSLKNTV